MRICRYERCSLRVGFYGNSDFFWKSYSFASNYDRLFCDKFKATLRAECDPCNRSRLSYWLYQILYNTARYVQITLGARAPITMPADCSVLHTPTICPNIRISWDIHPHIGMYSNVPPLLMSKLM